MRTTEQKKRRIPDEERKKNLIAVRVKDKELAALEEIAERENLPVAYFVREGIKLVLEKRLKQ
jgi:hypothetical protein